VHTGILTDGAVPSHEPRGSVAEVDSDLGVFDPPGSALPSAGIYSTAVIRVAVLMDVADMDAVMAAMQIKAPAEAMAYDGVLPETSVILVEA
jgi:hypothetical protein